MAQESGTILSAYLFKKGGIFKTWRRRFCILYKNETLDYFESCDSNEKGVGTRINVKPFSSNWFISVFLLTSLNRVSHQTAKAQWT
jgi:hypothetical protein